MNSMPISLQKAAELSGISSRFIRELEREHQALQPLRKDGKVLFRQQDIQRLSLLKTAIDRGYSIKEVAGLSDKYLSEMLGNQKSILPFLEAQEAYFQTHIGRFLDFIEIFDSVAADRVLSQQSILFRPREFVHGMVSPLMREIGMRWEAGKMNIAQEHLASNILRNLLGSLMRVHTKTSANGIINKRIVYATPKNQYHEFGILAAAILGCAGGIGGIYLGANIPYKDLAEVPKKTEVSTIILSKILDDQTHGDWLIELLEFKESLDPSVDVVIGGIVHPSERDVLIESGIIYLNSLMDLDRHLLLKGARF